MAARTRWRSEEPPPRVIDDVLAAQRAGCEAAGSPLYAEVLEAVAHDVAAGGPSHRLLDRCRGASFGDAVVLRFLAGVHELVLSDRAPALAAHYPSMGGRAGPGLGEAFLAVVAEHEGELAEAMDRPVQTNEVGRSVALRWGLQEVDRILGGPLRLLEVGASAGLNLWLDRYRYEAGGRAVGPRASPVRFVEPFDEPVPVLDGDLKVVERQGCDLAPIDATSEAGRLRLRSLVWPDQQARRARLDAALAVVADLAPVVEQADAVDWTRRHLVVPTPGVTTVLLHSIVLQYLPVARRRELVALVEDAGERASRSAPFAWLRTEPGGEVAETRLTTWPGGSTSVVATSGFHGPPVAAVGAP